MEQKTSKRDEENVKKMSTEDWEAGRLRLDT